jgi:hypothetical protein
MIKPVLGLWRGSDMARSVLLQKAYTAIVEHFIETGRAPHYTELAGTLGVQPGEAREVQRQAAEASVACWLVQDTDYIESWAPFSNVPTHYWVSVDGQQKWYGQ